MAERVNGNGNIHNDASFTSIQDCTQANISLIPEDLTFCIRHFLSDKDQRPPLNGCTQANISLVPEDLGYCIRQFLSDREQNMSAGMRQTLSEVEAEAEANMSALLHAFDEKFGNCLVGHGSAHK